MTTPNELPTEVQESTYTKIKTRRYFLKMLASIAFNGLASLGIGPLRNKIVQDARNLAKREIVEDAHPSFYREAQISIDKTSSSVGYPFVSAEFSKPGEAEIIWRTGNHGALGGEPTPIQIPQNIDEFFPDSFPSVLLYRGQNPELINQIEKEIRLGNPQVSVDMSKIGDSISADLNKFFHHMQKWFPFSENEVFFSSVDVVAKPDARETNSSDVPDSEVYDRLRRTFQIGLIKVGTSLLADFFLDFPRFLREYSLDFKPLSAKESRRGFLIKLPIRLAAVGLGISSAKDFSDHVSAVQGVQKYESTYLKNYPLASEPTINQYAGVLFKSVEESEILSPKLRLYLWRNLLAVYKIVKYRELHPEKPILSVWGNFHIDQMAMYALSSQQLFELLEKMATKHASEIREGFYGTYTFCTIMHTRWKDQKNDSQYQLQGIDIEVLPELFGLCVRHGFLLPV